MSHRKDKAGKYEDSYLSAVRDAQTKGAPDHKFVGHVESGKREYFEKGGLAIRVTPVCWGIPMDEVLFSKFLTMFFRNGNVMPWDTFATTESTYLPDARNEIHNMFLETDFPYLMMLDSDVLPQPMIVSRLMAHDKPIIGGWYPNKNKLKLSTPHPIVYDFISEGATALNWKHREYPGTGVERVDGMGAGCWLMKREVAEALGKSPYDMVKGTEDLKLSKKLLDLGIPMFVDWSLRCPHVGVSWT
jgi:hypothetical protein